MSALHSQTRQRADAVTAPPDRTAVAEHLHEVLPGTDWHRWNAGEGLVIREPVVRWR